VLKRVIVLMTVTGIWVFVMAMFFYSPGSGAPTWGWAALIFLWWFAIEFTKKPASKEEKKTGE